MKECARCGHNNARVAKFCKQCGHRFIDVARYKKPFLAKAADVLIYFFYLAILFGIGTCIARSM
jgi:hypothetical protein